jgi:hypothetical protein
MNARKQTRRRHPALVAPAAATVACLLGSAGPAQAGDLFGSFWHDRGAQAAPVRPSSQTQVPEPAPPAAPPAAPMAVPVTVPAAPPAFTTTTATIVPVPSPTYLIQPAAPTILVAPAPPPTVYLATPAAAAPNLFVGSTAPPPSYAAPAAPAAAPRMVETMPPSLFGRILGNFGERLVRFKYPRVAVTVGPAPASSPAPAALPVAMSAAVAAPVSPISPLAAPKAAPDDDVRPSRQR